MHPRKIKRGSHFIMPLLLMMLGIWEKSYPVPTAQPSSSSLYKRLSGYDDTSVFNFQRLPLLPVYNPRVATISFDQRRERVFDEKLAHILYFKQKYWAPLVGKCGQL